MGLNNESSPISLRLTVIPNMELRRADETADIYIIIPKCVCVCVCVFLHVLFENG